MGGRRLVLTLVAACTCWLVAAPAAEATFHLVQVREVYPGSVANPDAEYVELQMWSAGQHRVGSHAVRTYDAGGGVIGTSPFAADPPGDANVSRPYGRSPREALEVQLRSSFRSPLFEFGERT